MKYANPVWQGNKPAQSRDSRGFRVYQGFASSSMQDNRISR